MDQDLICGWLRLPPWSWPPDHHTLLGLPRGESDRETIEARAQERVLRVRPYQLAHPDEVTEAMNRLARALVCLTAAPAGHAPTAPRRHALTPGTDRTVRLWELPR